MPKLKICGFSDVQNAQGAAELGIDYVGLNFYSKSKRFVDDGTAKQIADAVRTKTKVVGLFVNEQAERVNHLVSEVGLDVVQLHGDETEDYLSEIQAPEVWKAVRVGSMKDIEEAYRFCKVTDKVLLDSKVEGAYGGTGIRVEKELLQAAKNLMPKAFVAGGITPENVNEVLSVCLPYGIDTAGGVEVSAGIKDLKVIETLLKCLKQDQS